MTTKTISREDVEHLARDLTAILQAARPAIVPFPAMASLNERYLERGYKAALVARLPTYGDGLYAILIHEQANRILGVLLWNEAANEWRLSDDRGPLLIMKAQLPSAKGARE